VAITVYQTVVAVYPSTLRTSTAATWDSTPSNGRLLHLWLALEKSVVDINPAPTLPAGWTLRAHTYLGGTCLTYATKTAASEGGTVTVTHPSAADTWIIIAETDGVFGSATAGGTNNDATPDLPTITPEAGEETLLLAAMSSRLAYDLSASPAAYTLDTNQTADELRALLWYRYIAAASGSYGGTATFVHWVGAAVIHASIAGTPPPPIADFDYDPVGGLAPLTVAFTDLSTGTPTSWAWTFGDGGTSTSQNPSHEYTVPGTYSVSLTATNANGSDTETKVALISVTADVGYEPPPPANAIIEIKASVPGSAKWGTAKWGEDVWSASAWQSITPESVDVSIRWGSTQPELGILSRPTAGSWAVRIHDPLRLLDPANADSPYFTDLVPGLPVRVNHRGLTIRQGIAESLGHEFVEGRSFGYMRVTDNLSRLANAAVPSDTTLADTLYARARDAISAAGVNVTVLPDPPSGDPALVAWVTGTEWSAWDWIADAAEQCLAIPYIDRIGRLGFRTWSTPLHRARELASPNLVNLQSIQTYQGLYSRVQAEDALGIETRALTPPPAYGKRTYVRDELVLDAGEWAQAVLEDRALPRIRWVPADVFPLTADDVEYFATIEAVELVSIRVDEESPAVLADAIIVGGEIEVTGKRESEALWRFAFEATQTPFLPLVVDGSDPAEYLFTEAGDEYLYPD
jgi:PKD repeat protein